MSSISLRSCLLGDVFVVAAKCICNIESTRYCFCNVICVAYVICIRK